MTTLQRIEKLKAEAKELAFLTTGLTSTSLLAAYDKLEYARFHAAAVEIGQEKV